MRYEWEDKLDAEKIIKGLKLPRGIKVAGIAFYKDDGEAEACYHHVFKGDYEMQDFDVIDDIKGDVTREHRKQTARSETFYGKASFDSFTKGKTNG